MTVIDNERVARFRADAEGLTPRHDDKSIESMVQHLSEQLKGYGITHITPDLVDLLWGLLPLSLDFIITSIQITCISPSCGHASFNHAEGGLDLFGVALLAFEKKIGQAL